MLSFSFNGIRKDYVHMLRGRKRPPWPTLARNILTVPGRPGGYLQGTEIQPRIIEVPIAIRGQNIGDLQKLKEDLASWLVTDEPKELVFDDEPDRTYYAVVDETIDFDEIAYLGQGTVRFLCPDPYKYGPLRTQTINAPPASFSRNSIAYLSDGTQVSANQPRFEQGGVLVEEGTVNLIPSALAKNLTSAWTSGNLNGTYTLSVRGGTGQVNISGGYTGSVAVGQALTFNVSNATITLTPANGTPQFVQLEQKRYATSFADGTRQPETLTLPTDGVLNPEEGTIEIQIAPLLSSKVAALQYGFHDFAWNDGANAGLIIRREIDKIVILSIVANSNITRADISRVWNPNEPIGVAVRYTNKNVECFVNGVKVATLQRFKTPVASNFGIGCRLDGGTNGNAIYKGFRLSRIARSDAEIMEAYQNGFTVDEYTTAYLPFDGSLEVQTPTIVTNEGTAETYPTFTAYVKQPITFLDIIAPDAYMRVGQPVNTETQMPVQREELILWDQMSTTTGWTSGGTIVDGTVVGTIESTGYLFQPSNYGTGTGWHGPALKKSLSNVLENFTVEALVELYNDDPDMIGRVEVYLLDETGAVVGKMAMKDVELGSSTAYAEARIGGAAVNYHLINEHGRYRWTWNDFYGVLRMGRHNGQWFAYVAKIDKSTGKHHSRMYRTYIDADQQFTKNLAQIEVHFGQMKQYKPANVRIQDIKVYKWNPITQSEIPYIAYPGDVLEFDHKNAVVYRNGEPIMNQKDFGARFFPLATDATELAVNPSDAAIVEVEYRPRYK